MALEIYETLTGFGHENVSATHRSTIEFTKDTQLSKKGDCILIVATDKSLNDLSGKFKEALCNADAKLTIHIQVGNLIELVHAQGTPHLILNHPTEMVIRKSDYISDRTFAIRADKAAKDLNRELVKKLQNPNQKAQIKLILTIPAP